MLSLQPECAEAGSGARELAVAGGKSGGEKRDQEREQRAGGGLLGVLQVKTAPISQAQRHGNGTHDESGPNHPQKHRTFSDGLHFPCRRCWTSACS